MRILVSLAIALIAIGVYCNYTLIDVVVLSELEKQPLIFGNDLCENVYSGDVSVAFLTALQQKLISLFRDKFAFRAKIVNKEVYVKKLGGKSDFNVVELGYREALKNDNALEGGVNIKRVKCEIIKAVTDGFPPKLLICPNLTDVNIFLNYIPNFNCLDLSKYLHVWTIVQISAEPLLLQLLQPPEWPVPKYFGSCGRLIFVEDCGQMLTNFRDAPWVVRANLAVELLVAAFTFTFHHPKFAFYLLDPSPDNIAVGENGSIRFIDLENVIVVDKHPENDVVIADFFSQHSTIHVPCHSCYEMSPKDICRHQVSDHNVYAVCNEILFNTSIIISGGLLHDSANQEFDLLLKDCVVNSKNKNRFDTAQQIINLLRGVM